MDEEPSQSHREEDSDGFDDDFGDFEEADETSPPRDNDTNTVAIENVDGLAGGIARHEIGDDKIDASRYISAALTPDEYEQMIREDLKKIGMEWNNDDSIVSSEKFTDLEGPDRYGSLLALKEPEPSEDDLDPMKMSRDVRFKLVQELLDSPPK